MGVYLSTPNTDKISTDGKTERFTYGVSSMQGWRQTQEDAHNCIANFDTDPHSALFAVYDGHGGSEVAQYTSMHFPDYMKTTKLYRDGGDPIDTFQAAFMSFDELLNQEDTIKQLRAIAGFDTENIADEVEAEKQEAALLVEEATMPLEEVLSKYTDVSRSACQLSPATTRQCSANGHSDHREAIGTADICQTSDKLHEEFAESSKSEKITSHNKSCQEVDAKISAEDCIRDETASSVGNLTTNVINNKECAEVENSGENTLTAGSDTEPKRLKNGLDASPKVSEDKIEDDASCSSFGAGSSEPSTSGCSSHASRNTRSLQSAIFDDEIGDDIDDDDDDDEEEDDDDDDDDTDKDAQWMEEYGDDDMWEDCSDSEEEDDDTRTPFQSIPFRDMEEPGADSGCTALVALLRASQLIVANVGDSRCVLCRDGKAVDLSVDHKPEDGPERNRIENAGGKVTKDGRVNGGLNLSRAMGDHCYKTNRDIAAKDQMISACPDVQVVDLTSLDSFFILACDGIWNVMSSQDAVDFVKEQLEHDPGLYTTPSKICEKMFTFCLAPDTSGDGTGCDNMTCIIVLLDDRLNASRGDARSPKATATVDGTCSKPGDEVGVDAKNARNLLKSDEAIQKITESSDTSTIGQGGDQITGGGLDLDWCGKNKRNATDIDVTIDKKCAKTD